MTIARVEPVDEASPSPEALARIVHLLEVGGVIACPTESMYGLSTDYGSCSGARRIRRIKGLAESRPFLILVPVHGWLHRIRRYGPWDFPSSRLATTFWPGPLTLVVPARSGYALPEYANMSDQTVALRVSPDPFIRALLEARGGRPLISTSANPAGREPARDLRTLREYFEEGEEIIDLVVDAGSRSGPPSTLVSVTDGTPRILRSGPIGEAEIEAALRS